MSLKRYQIALLSFALGIFTVTFSVAWLLKVRHQNENRIQNSAEYEIIDVYFSSTVDDPGSLYCEVTYPVQRAVRRLTINEKTRLAEYAYRALDELLSGPAGYEKDNGYFTSINDGVKINSIAIENGLATVDFNERLNEGVAGSCRVQAIRSQITETLKQFPEITDVVISVNGEIEEILQP